MSTNTLQGPALSPRRGDKNQTRQKRDNHHSRLYIILTGAAVGRQTTRAPTFRQAKQASGGIHIRRFALRSFHRHGVLGITVIPEGIELVGWFIDGKPLIHLERVAEDGQIRGDLGDLDVAHVPARLISRIIGHEHHPARPGGHALTRASEQVEVAALEVVVVFTHPAPRLQVRDLQALVGAIRAAQRHGDLGVGARVVDRRCLDDDLVLAFGGRVGVGNAVVVESCKGTARVESEEREDNGYLHHACKGKVNGLSYL